MRYIIVSFLICIGVFAKSSIPSPLPMPKAVFIDITPNICDEACLEELANNEMYFTFLAKYPYLEDKNRVEKTYKRVSLLFEVKPLEFEYDFSNEGAKVKLAIITPYKRIKKYAITSVNSIIAYLMSRNSAFDIEVFDIEDETAEELDLALGQIRQNGYKVVIAPVTPVGANYLAQNASDLLVFIPTINSSQTFNSTNNVLYGGIDYEKQIQTLLNVSNQKIATFSDGSGLSSRLDALVVQNSPDIAYNKQIIGEKINLKYMLKGNKILQNASIFLNMSLIKSSLLSSQLRSYDISPYVLLSTQINFNPLLLTLTQYADRKKMYIANSIGEIPFQTKAINELFKHSIEYDWVNYATNVGLDYLYANFYTSENERIFKEELNGNQIAYGVSLYKPSRFGFSLVGE